VSNLWDWVVVKHPIPHVLRTYRSELDPVAGGGAEDGFERGIDDVGVLANTPPHAFGAGGFYVANCSCIRTG
jgi:hypothetical protein